MGLARFQQEAGGYDTTAAAGLTLSGQVMGTIDYMSSEQAMDTHRADERSDVYSLGCTLFYLLMGRALYPEETITKKIMAHREEPVPSLCALRRDVPKDLDAVFQKMVAKQAKDRSESNRTLRRTQAFFAAPVTRPSSPAARLARWATSRQYSRRFSNWSFAID